MLDLQGIHEVNQVARQCSGLTIADRFGGKKTRVAITARIGNQYAIPLLRQRRRDVGVTVNVVRPAVQQDHHRTVCRADFGIGDIQQSGLDVFQRPEGNVTPRRNHVDFSRRHIGGVDR
ncbi:hypothetical protein D3C86_1641080 [compost metagenome]